MAPFAPTPEACEATEASPLDLMIRLKQLEDRIGRGLRDFEDVGNALGEIQADKRLYMARYGTFENYCEARWHLAARTAYQFIDAANVASNLRNCSEIPPSNEAQCRVLASLEPEDQVAVWRRASETAPDGKMTAKHLLETKRDYCGERHACDISSGWSLDDATEYLATKLHEISLRWPAEHLEVMADQLRCLADDLTKHGELRP